MSIFHYSVIGQFFLQLRYSFNDTSFLSCTSSECDYLTVVAKMTAIGTFTCTLSVSNYSCECIEHINHSLLLQTYVSSPRTWVHVTATMNSGTTTGPRIRADHSSMVAVKAITTDSMTSGHVKIDASRIFHLHLRRRHLPHPWHLHRRLRGEWILCSSVVQEKLLDYKLEHIHD